MGRQEVLRGRQGPEVLALQSACHTPADPTLAMRARAPGQASRVTARQPCLPLMQILSHHRCVVKSGGMVVFVDAECLSCGNVRHVVNA